MGFRLGEENCIHDASQRSDSDRRLASLPAQLAKLSPTSPLLPAGGIIDRILIVPDPPSAPIGDIAAFLDRLLFLTEAFAASDDIAEL
jgi:hypothetical protein